MSQLTKKAYQRKALFIGLSVFGAVALIATGFAAVAFADNDDIRHLGAKAE